MPRDAPHPHAGDDAFTHRRDAEPRIVGRNPQVAGEGNLESAADAMRLDRGDDDGVHRLELAERALPVAEERHRDLAARQRGDVDARAERATRAAQHDDAQAVGGREVVRERIQIASPLLVGAIEHVGPVQDERRHLTLARAEHRFEVHRCLRGARVCHDSDISLNLISDPAEHRSSPADTSAQSDLEREVLRRRTFAIISHPDAGKTTLTEKLLLYAGAIELAGAVRTRGNRRHATSDWMELEQQRGISITAAALEFELDGRRMSLLDTPGHKDFSEDTYRALIAADSVVMVIDAANGVEEQTRKLFEVCRRHRLPILTFVNKFDRPARDPLELVDDVERTLGISAAPVNWPIGNAEKFRGRLRHRQPQAAALRARSAGAVSSAGGRGVARRSARPRAHRRRSLRSLHRVARRHPDGGHARTTSPSTARAGRRPCSSAAR